VPHNLFDDDEIASAYQATSGDRFDADVLDPTVDFLADLAGDGAALELAIGTGRVALPLSRRGVRVVGIDLAPAMVKQLRAQPGGADIEVTIGDIATTRVEGSFSLVYLVYNTIGNLTSQDEQVEVFRNAAAHLEPGGCFVIEVGVPDLRRLPPGETARVFSHHKGYVGFDEYTDPVEQLACSHHWYVERDHPQVFLTPFRYVWPAELDLMARLAGLSRRERWADWNRQPFTADSAAHVSVWEKPA
jgi:SAM-dependent methyltransferase